MELLWANNLVKRCSLLIGWTDVGILISTTPTQQTWLSIFRTFRISFGWGELPSKNLTKCRPCVAFAKCKKFQWKTGKTKRKPILVEIDFWSDKVPGEVLAIIQIIYWSSFMVHLYHLLDSPVIYTAEMRGILENTPPEAICTPRPGRLPEGNLEGRGVQNQCWGKSRGPRGA